MRPAKYFNFADVFDKRCTYILLEHSQYNLAIKIEGNKISHFGLIYDHGRNELKVLREYINEMF